MFWRRKPSRESDLPFREAAESPKGAILVSFWRLPGMPLDSGTPADWLVEARRSPFFVNASGIRAIWTGPDPPMKFSPASAICSGLNH